MIEKRGASLFFSYGKLMMCGLLESNYIDREFRCKVFFTILINLTVIGLPFASSCVKIGIGEAVWVE